MATKLSERLAPGVPTPKRVRVAADGRAGTVQMVYYDRLRTGDSYDELTVDLDAGGTVRGSADLFESIDDEPAAVAARQLEITVVRPLGGGIPPRPDAIRPLAERVARGIMTGGDGMAQRLVLEMPGDRYGGGWSLGPLTDRIERLLRGEQR